MEEEAKVTKKRLMPAEQDRQIAEEIAEAGVLLATVEANLEIQTALAAYGTDAAELATGRTLESAAQDGMTARQGALASESGTAAKAIADTTTLKTRYADFREVCRARVLSPTLRQALSLSGAIPADRQKFMTHARTAYAEAGKPELQGLLGKLGFGPDVLTARLTDLDALETSVAAAREAAGTAKGATIARNAAHKSLRQWVTALKRIARRALRTRPDLAAKLKL